MPGRPLQASLRYCATPSKFSNIPSKCFTRELRLEKRDSRLTPMASCPERVQPTDGSKQSQDCCPGRNNGNSGQAEPSGLGGGRVLWESSYGLQPSIVTFVIRSLALSEANLALVDEDTNNGATL